MIVREILVDVIFSSSGLSTHILGFCSNSLALVDWTTVPHDEMSDEDDYYISYNMNFPPRDLQNVKLAKRAIGRAVVGLELERALLRWRCCNRMVSDRLLTKALSSSAVRRCSNIFSPSGPKVYLWNKTPKTSEPYFSLSDLYFPSVTLAGAASPPASGTCWKES
jgi:hypothetical protein